MNVNKELTPYGLQLYLYLAANANGYEFALSPQDAKEQAGICRTAFYDYLRKLETHGYLVWKHTNTYDYYITTLLNMLAGLLAPTEGRVWIDETDLYSLDDKALSRLRNEKIGVIPQGRSAIDTLTVMENILLPAKLYGKPLLAESPRQWMDDLGIAHLQDARPAELSGGELRRMAIARAMIQGGDILLADEPTGDLDDENTALVLSTFRAAAHAGKAVLLVTHEKDALKYADQVYQMSAGMIQPVGQNKEQP